MTDLTTMTDEEIEIEIERLCEEQERRHRVALKAIQRQVALALPVGLYASVR